MEERHAEFVRHVLEQSLLPPPELLVALAAVVVAVLLNVFLVNAVSKKLHEDVWGGQFPYGKFLWHARAIGFLEGVIYPVSWLMGRPEFIGAWLILKVAGHWGQWQRDVKDDEGKTIIAGRTVYNIFLIGTGLSLINGIAAGPAAGLIFVRAHVCAGVWTLLGVLAVNLILLKWANKKAG